MATAVPDFEVSGNRGTCIAVPPKSEIPPSTVLDSVYENEPAAGAAENSRFGVFYNFHANNLEIFGGTAVSRGPATAVWQPRYQFPDLLATAVHTAKYRGKLAVRRYYVP